MHKKEIWIKINTKYNCIDFNSNLVKAVVKMMIITGDLL